MEELSKNKKKNFHKKHPIIHSVVVILVLVIMVSFIYVYKSDMKFLEKTSDKKVFSEGEKFEILKNLSNNSEDTLSIEEKRAILNNVSNNKSDDAFKYSQEGKLQILRSLQE